MNLHLLLIRCLCDYRCLFCTMGSEDYVAEQTALLRDFDYDAEWDRIEQALRGGTQDDQTVALHIMGNDPVTHPHLVRAISLASELGFAPIVLETNGLRLDDPAFAREVVDAGVSFFKIPVYGSSAPVHDAIVRLDGAFERLHGALSNLAQLGAEVQLHALILKQNAHELPRSRFRYPISFRYPFRHDRADVPYDHYAPRLWDVPATVLFRSDLTIPCINGRRDPTLLEESRVRPETPNERDEDTHVVHRRPSKCSPQTCPDFGGCRGIYPDYLLTYGEDEFEHRPGVAEAYLECDLGWGRLLDKLNGR